jgi:acyl-CoA synthetase (AMP-forming)/AMP-acid ligase II
VRLTELIDDACARWSDNIAFRVPDTGASWTYRRVKEESDAIATALQHAGSGPGHAVAVLSPNSPDAFIAQLGILKSGAAYVPLNTKSATSDWVAVSSGAGADALIFGASMAEQSRELLDRNPGLWLTRSIGVAEGVGTVAEWISEFAGREPARVVDDREDPCWIIGSGGTTGTPKAVAMPNRAMVTQTLALLGHMPDASPVHLVSAPLTHAAGALTYPVLLQGGETIVMDGAPAGALLAAIDEYRVNRLFMPPTAIYAMLADPKLGDYDYSSLRYFLYGAAPMSPSKLREAMNTFGPVMAQFFGQAEAPMICTWFGPREHAAALADPALAHRLSSCGRPSAVAAIRIVGDDGAPVPVGEVGEIAVKTELRMLGYLNVPEESAKLAVADGYVRTGDVGYLDADGFVYISDRARDMIVTGGFNVFPSEVERVVWTHPSVRDCAVIGIPDDYWGEAVTAVIELKDGAAEATEAILALCRQELGPVKTPKRVIYRSLPRSAVGKVLKRALREEQTNN